MGGLKPPSGIEPVGDVGNFPTSANRADGFVVYPQFGGNIVVALLRRPLQTSFDERSHQLAFERRWDLLDEIELMKERQAGAA